MRRKLRTALLPRGSRSTTSTCILPSAHSRGSAAPGPSGPGQGPLLLQGAMPSEWPPSRRFDLFPKGGSQSQWRDPPLRLSNTILFLPFPTDQILPEGASTIGTSDLLGGHPLAHPRAPCWAPQPHQGTSPGTLPRKAFQPQRRPHSVAVSEARPGNDAAEWGWRQGAVGRESRSLVVKTTISKQLLMLCLYGFLQM